MPRQAKKTIILIFTGYILLLLALHLIPNSDVLPSLDRSDVHIDYLLHVLLFLPWMPLLFILKHSGMVGKIAKPFTWFMIGLALAAGFEAVHYWLPWRSFNLWDMALNITGLGIGTALLLIRKE